MLKPIRDNDAIWHHRIFPVLLASTRLFANEVAMHMLTDDDVIRHHDFYAFPVKILGNSFRIFRISREFFLEISSRFVISGSKLVIV